LRSSGEGEPKVDDLYELGLSIFRQQEDVVRLNIAKKTFLEKSNT